MKLDASSPLPLYFQLRELIKGQILGGELQAGDEIPSESKLCQQYGLSRATVKQALDGLVLEGLIVRKRGSGTFVNKKSISHHFFEEPSFKMDSERQGLPPVTSKLVNACFIADGGKAAQELQLDGEEEIYCIRRVRYLGAEPVVLESNYIPKEYMKGVMEQDLQELAVYTYIQETNHLRFDSYKIDIAAILLDKYEQDIFEVKGGCGLRILRTSYSNNVPIMYNERLFCGSRCSLNMKYKYSSAGPANDLLEGGISFFR